MLYTCILAYSFRFLFVVHSLGFGQLLTSLNEAKGALPGSDEDFGFLNSLLQSRELQALVQVHNSISKSINGSEDGIDSPLSGTVATPVVTNVEDLSFDVLDVLHPLASRYREARELYRVLQKPHVQALLMAHDSVALKDYFPRLPDNAFDLDEEEETVKIVQLVKSSEPMVCFNFPSLCSGERKLTFRVVTDSLTWCRSFSCYSVWISLGKLPSNRLL